VYQLSLSSCYIQYFTQNQKEMLTTYLAAQSAWAPPLVCNSKQELQNRRRLARDKVTMRVGNGSKVDVMALGTLSLVLHSGLVLNLNKYYYVPALSMNIISGSCLLQDGYSFKFENNGCSIYMN
jgi:hypothetical protein